MTWRNIAMIAELNYQRDGHQLAVESNERRDAEESRLRNEKHQADMAAWNEADRTRDGKLTGLAEAHELTEERLAAWIGIKRREAWEAANWAAMPDDCDWQLPAEDSAHLREWAGKNKGQVIEDLVFNKKI